MSKPNLTALLAKERWYEIEIERTKMAFQGVSRHDAQTLKVLHGRVEELSREYKDLTGRDYETQR